MLDFLLQHFTTTGPSQHWHVLQIIPFCVSSQKPEDCTGCKGSPAKDQEPECGTTIQASRPFRASPSEPERPWPHPGIHPHSTPQSTQTLQHPCFPWARAEVSSRFWPLVGSDWCSLASELSALWGRDGDRHGRVQRELLRRAWESFTPGQGRPTPHLPSLPPAHSCSRRWGIRSSTLCLRKKQGWLWAMSGF